MTQGEGGTPALQQPQPALRTSAGGEVPPGPAWSQGWPVSGCDEAREPCCWQGRRACPCPWGSPGPSDCRPLITRRHVDVQRPAPLAEGTFLTLSRGLRFRNGETEASRVPSGPAGVGGGGPQATPSRAPRLAARWSVEDEEEAACEQHRRDTERQLQAQDEDEGSPSPEQSEQEKL